MSGDLLAILEFWMGGRCRRPRKLPVGGRGAVGVVKGSPVAGQTVSLDGELTSRKIGIAEAGGSLRGEEASRVKSRADRLWGDDTGDCVVARKSCKICGKLGHWIGECKALIGALRKEWKEVGSLKKDVSDELDARMIVKSSEGPVPVGLEIEKNKNVVEDVDWQVVEARKVGHMALPQLDMVCSTSQSLMGTSFSASDVLKSSVMDEGPLVPCSFPNSLDRDFSCEDVWVALSEIADDKAPGKLY
ncbi:hypothetical protein Dimus_023083 [Dionaea muscipula]